MCRFPLHLVIFPAVHLAAMSEADDEDAEEIRNFKKSVVMLLDQRGETPIFVETVTRFASDERAALGGGPHTKIDIFPIPSDLVPSAKSYFRKAFLEEGSWWGQHKKLLEVQGRRGVRGLIPKGFGYVHVDFGLGESIAHVIDDGAQFPRELARDVVLGLLELDILYRPFQNEADYFSAIKNVKYKFAPFDWTPALSNAT